MSNKQQNNQSSVSVEQEIYNSVNPPNSSSDYLPGYAVQENQPMPTYQQFEEGTDNGNGYSGGAYGEKIPTLSPSSDQPTLSQDMQTLSDDGRYSDFYFKDVDKISNNDENILDNAMKGKHTADLYDGAAEQFDNDLDWDKEAHENLAASDKGMKVLQQGLGGSDLGWDGEPYDGYTNQTQKAITTLDSNLAEDKARLDGLYNELTSEHVNLADGLTDSDYVTNLEKAQDLDKHVGNDQNFVSSDQKILNDQPDEYFTKAQLDATKSALRSVDSHIEAEKQIVHGLDNESMSILNDSINSSSSDDLPLTNVENNEYNQEKTLSNQISKDVITQEERIASGLQKDISAGQKGFHFKDVDDNIPENPTYEQANAAVHRLYSNTNWGSFDYISNGASFAPSTDPNHPSSQYGQLMWHDPSDTKSTGDWANNANWPASRPEQYEAGLRMANTGTQSNADIAGGPSEGFWNSFPSIQGVKYLDPREIVLMSELSPTDKRGNRDALNADVNKLESDFRSLPSSASEINVQDAYMNTKAAFDDGNIPSFDKARDHMISALKQMPVEYQETIMKDFANLDKVASQIVTDKAIVARYAHNYVQEHPEHFMHSAPADPMQAHEFNQQGYKDLDSEEARIAQLKQENAQEAETVSREIGEHVDSGNSSVGSTQPMVGGSKHVTLDQAVAAEKSLYQGFSPYRSTHDTMQGNWDLGGDPNTTGNLATTRVFDWRNPSQEALTIAKTSPFALSFSNQTFASAQDMIHLGSVVDNADPTPETAKLAGAFQSFKAHSQEGDVPAYNMAKAHMSEAIKDYESQSTVLGADSKVLNEAFSAAVRSSDQTVNNRGIVQQYLHQNDPVAEAGFHAVPLADVDPEQAAQDLKGEESELKANHDKIASSVDAKIVDMDKQADMGQTDFRAKVKENEGFINSSQLSQQQINAQTSEETNLNNIGSAQANKINQLQQDVIHVQNSGVSGKLAQNEIASLNVAKSNVEAEKTGDANLSQNLPEMTNSMGAMGIQLTGSVIHGQDEAPTLSSFDNNNLADDKIVASQIASDPASVKAQGVEEIDKHIAQEKQDVNEINSWEHEAKAAGSGNPFLGAIATEYGTDDANASGQIKHDIAGEEALASSLGGGSVVAPPQSLSPEMFEGSEAVYKADMQAQDNYRNDVNQEDNIFAGSHQASASQFGHDINNHESVDLNNLTSATRENSATIPDNFHGSGNDKLGNDLNHFASNRAIEDNNSMLASTGSMSVEAEASSATWGNNVAHHEVTSSTHINEAGELANLDSSNVALDRARLKEDQMSFVDKVDVGHDISDVQHNIDADKQDFAHANNWSSQEGFEGHNILSNDEKTISQDEKNEQALLGDFKAEQAHVPANAGGSAHGGSAHGASAHNHPHSTGGHKSQVPQNHSKSSAHGGNSGNSSKGANDDQPTGEQVGKLENSVNNNLHVLGSKYGDANMNGDNDYEDFTKLLNHLHSKGSSRYQADQAFDGEFKNIEGDMKTLEGMNANPTQERDAYSDLVHQNQQLSGQAARHALCYCTGTMIKTVDGERPVESLNVGDKVITASGDIKEIAWLGHQDMAFHKNDSLKGLTPVCFVKDSIADGVPHRNLYVSPAHGMAFKAKTSGLFGRKSKDILARASSLVNGKSIYHSSVKQASYWHVELEGGHDILLANGAASESFADHGEKSFFTDGKIVKVATKVDDILPREKNGRFVKSIKNELMNRVPLLNRKLVVNE